jgi:hypothetical protein
MGMFDYVTYKGHSDWQSKDTPAQALDNYKIEQDQDSGHWCLWYEEYDAEWVDQGSQFGDSLVKTNVRWQFCEEFDGVIRFYRSADGHKTWIEYEALFMDGRMLKIKQIHNEPLTRWYTDGLNDKGIEL